MEHYFIVFKHTNTGQELQGVRSLWLQFEKQLRTFCEKYAIEASLSNCFYLCDLSDVVFESLPDDLCDNWKKGSVAGSYTLKVHPKNEALKKDWHNLRKLRIERNRLDKAIGGTNPFEQAGFSFNEAKNYILFVISDKYDYNIPGDCIEISNIEYQMLKDD